MTTKLSFICPTCLSDNRTAKVTMSCYPKASDGGSFKISVFGLCTICKTRWLSETTVKPEVVK